MSFKMSCGTGRSRRTFAIIFHPDAGKTTMTEKLLLWGKAIQVAGMVKSRKSDRAATSDWMEMEKERGIRSPRLLCSSHIKVHTINLLDTPGHETSRKILIVRLPRLTLHSW